MTCNKCGAINGEEAYFVATRGMKLCAGCAENDVLYLRQQRDEALASCAAMRETLEHITHRDVVCALAAKQIAEEALLPDAGRALLDRLRRLQRCAEALKALAYHTERTSCEDGQCRIDATAALAALENEKP